MPAPVEALPADYEDRVRELVARNSALIGAPLTLGTAAQRNEEWRDFHKACARLVHDLDSHYGITSRRSAT